MRRFFSFAAIVVLFCLFGLGVSAKETTKTGNKLPDFLKEAIKVLPKKDLVTGLELPKERRLSNEQIVFISDMPAWCAEMKILQGCDKIGQAFVLEGQFPIYVNGDSVHTKSDYALHSKIWEQQISPAIIYIWAGLLYHEESHAQGNMSEAVAYARELALLKYYESKSCFALASWAPEHIATVGALAAKLEQEKITIVVSFSSPLPPSPPNPANPLEPKLAARAEKKKLANSFCEQMIGQANPVLQKEVAQNFPTGPPPGPEKQ